MVEIALLGHRSLSNSLMRPSPHFVDADRLLQTLRQRSKIDSHSGQQGPHLARRTTHMKRSRIIVAIGALALALFGAGTVLAAGDKGQGGGGDRGQGGGDRGQSGGDRGQGHGVDGAPGQLRADQRSDLRRDVMEEQVRKKKAGEEAAAPPARQLSPQQRAELRRQLREQTGNPPDPNDRSGRLPLKGG
jgi:mono/diheme cytochrome c family protein